MLRPLVRVVVVAPSEPVPTAARGRAPSRLLLAAVIAYAAIAFFVDYATAYSRMPRSLHSRATTALPAKWRDSGPEKSATCVSKTNQKALTEYYSPREAERAAEFVAIEYGREMEAYQCGRCQLWHLSPVEGRTQSLCATAKVPMASRSKRIPDATRNEMPNSGARAASD